MCYTIEQLAQRELDYAMRSYAPEHILAELQEKVEKLREGILNKWQGRPMYNVSGFEHPPLYGFSENWQPQLFEWGLIPSWVKDKETAIKLSNQTLNARSETIFEKPSFRDAAKSKRCLIFIKGFYEHHHHKNKTYPYLIRRADSEPMVMAGLWSEWIDKASGEVVKSASIVTVEGNKLMTHIHNNPKLEGARMPLILERESLETWINSTDKNEIQNLMKPLADEKLQAYTVRNLKGKESVGDSEEATKEFHYAELE